LSYVTFRADFAAFYPFVLFLFVELYHSHLGAQRILALIAPQVVGSTTVVFATVITQMSQDPFRLDANAIMVPSGDQAAQQSSKGSKVS
jgi:hypothetical protein